MKSKIIITLLSLLPLFGAAQVYRAPSLYGVAEYRLSADSALHVPLDTALRSSKLRAGAVVYNTGDSSLYSWNGAYWVKQGRTGGSGAVPTLTQVLQAGNTSPYNINLFGNNGTSANDTLNMYVTRSGPGPGIGRSRLIMTSKAQTSASVELLSSGGVVLTSNKLTTPTATGIMVVGYDKQYINSADGSQLLLGGGALSFGNPGIQISTGGTPTSPSYINISGSISEMTRYITAGVYTMAASDRLVIASPSTSLINLPDPTQCPGRSYYIGSANTTGTFTAVMCSAAPINGQGWTGGFTRLHEMWKFIAVPNGTSYEWLAISYAADLTKNIKTITSSTSLNDSDYSVFASAASGAITVTLPDVTANPGKIYVIKKTDATINTVTVNTTGSVNIDGGATYGLTLQYQSVTVQSDGAKWWVIAKN